MTFVPDERRSYETHFFVLAMAFLAVTIWAVADEVWVRRPWKRFQAAYAAQVGSGSVQIRQIVIPDLQAVDRCPTCHAGADDPKSIGEDVPAVLRLHPRHDELLGRHPVERFGCTPCHSGQGLALTAGTAHGDDDPSWTQPLERPELLEARCAACHPGSGILTGASSLASGRRLFETLGCGGCHSTGSQPAKKRGPKLTQIRSKLRSGAMLEWIRDPQQRRRDTRMPQFWPDAAKEIRDAESLAISAYLTASSEPWDLSIGWPEPSAELAAAGKELFDRVGCRGCHVLGSGADDLELGSQSEAPDFFGEEETTQELPPIDFGPPLGAVGSRVTYGFIAAWASSPKTYWDGAKMPSLRLSRAEAAAIAAYLVGLATEAPPPVPKELVEPDPDLIAQGRVLIRKYGCYGCHEIKGFEGLPPPGPDLGEYGRKATHEMYFGDHPPPTASRTWVLYSTTKLSKPRVFSGRSVEAVMPDFGLTGEELSALLVYLRSLTTETVPPPFLDRVRSDPGALLLADSNCSGCHTPGDRPGDLERYYADPRLAPPTLAGEGARVRPEWLFGFLLSPRPLRPWLDVRMPTYALTEPDARALVRHLSALSGARSDFRFRPAEPYTQARAALGDELFSRLKCLTCHRVDGADVPEGGSLAPDLGLARERLDPAWVRHFIDDPGALLPGTSMPQFFPSGRSPYPDILDGDAAAQTELIVDHLMNLGLAPTDTIKSPSSLPSGSFGRALGDQGEKP
ncbi:MAG: c-type cytochrome [Deltaproteobacteria bacterium]|nr:c-type cytochrome [Deltaproteobacteria bacterium]